MMRPNKDYPNAYDYTEFDCVDLKGYFPARLMNMVMASTVKGEFAKLYDFIRTDKK